MNQEAIKDNNICHEISISAVSELAKFQMEQLNNIKSRFDGLIYVRTTGVLDCDLTDVKYAKYPKQFYKKLKEQNSESCIYLNIPNTIITVNQLRGGELVDVCGYVTVAARDNIYSLRVEVTDIKINNHEQSSIVQLNRDLLTEINNIQVENYDFPNKNHYERIVNCALIHPISETTVKDFNDALGNRSDFDCKFFEVNISDPEALIKTLKEIGTLNADVVAIIRGGGDGFEVFNSIDVCRAFNAIKCHKILGLGHKENSTLLDLFADHVAATPSLLGTYVQRKLDHVDKFRKAIYRKSKFEENKPLKTQPQILITPQDDVKLPQVIKNQRIIMAMFAVMIILILWK